MDVFTAVHLYKETVTYINIYIYRHVKLSVEHVYIHFYLYIYIYITLYYLHMRMYLTVYPISTQVCRNMFDQWSIQPNPIKKTYNKYVPHSQEKCPPFSCTMTISSHGAAYPTARHHGIVESTFISWPHVNVHLFKNVRFNFLDLHFGGGSQKGRTIPSFVISTSLGSTEFVGRI